MNKIFIMDNGATMHEHWPLVTFVAETLAKKVAGLDEDGIDVRFTVGGRKHNKAFLKGDNGRKAFRQSLDNAWPANTQNENTLTDMNQMFNEVLGDWTRKQRPATTLLVLTDGVWVKTSDAQIQKTILQFAEATKTSVVGRRHFSIQFIRFGELGTERLRWLDDEFSKAHGLGYESHL